MDVLEKEQNTDLIGYWTIEVFEGDTDKKIDEISGYNLITTSGKGLILDRIFGLSSVAAITGLAVGTSATAAAVGDTAITGAAFKAFESTPTRSSLTVTGSVLYGTGEANINIQELGALTGAGGTLLNRIAPIGPFNKTSAVSIRVTLQLTQS